MSCFEELKTGFVNQHGLVNVEEALWIKPKPDNNAKPLILSFRSDLPIFIDISGETAGTKLFEYIKRQLFCLNCLQFGRSRGMC